MGRKKKYHTEKEKNEAQKRWWMEHYERNKDVLKKKSLERYYKNKNEKNGSL